MQMNQKLVRQFPSKLEDADTISLSSTSSQSQKQSIIARDLYNNVVKQLNKNEQKYKQILKENSNFNYQLYKPKLGSFGQTKNNLNSQLLEKQLDRLMEDQCSLDKQLSKISFKLQQVEELKQMETQNYIDHFSLLRSIWNRSSSNARPEQKIDEISCRISSIKNHIKGMMNRQNATQSIQLQRYVRHSKQYCELRREYEKLQKQLQKRQDVFNNKIKGMEMQISSLNQTNTQLLRKLNEEGQKTRKKQEQILKLMQKCQSVELEILKKQKQIKKISKQGHCESLESLNINTKMIKFANKSDNLTVIILPSIVERDAQHSTIKTLHQIRTFLQAAPVIPNLQNFIEGRVSSLHSCLKNVHSELFDKMEVRRTSRRKNTMERNEVNRSQVNVGSQDKKKRFERTKFFD